MLLHVHKVENFNWRNLLYLTYRKWKSLTGELYDILRYIHEVEKFSWATLLHLMSTK